MRPIGRPNRSESFTFRQGGDFVRIELNGGVLRAAERMNNEDEYTYLTGAAQLVRFLEFLQRVVDGFREVHNPGNTVAYTFRADNRWLRVEENMGNVKFSTRLDSEEEYVYLTGTDEDVAVQSFLIQAATALDNDTIGIGEP